MRYHITIGVTGIVSIILFSCNLKKSYYYNDGDKEEVVEASSDSEAYLTAFRKFQISKKVNDDMTKTMGQSYRVLSTNFILYNNKHEDITYKVTFENRDSLESEIVKDITSLPNSIQRTVDEIREEKHGVGARYDTGGLYLAPVKVLSAKFVEEEYSNYKNVRLSFKNTSNKKISAIRFKWYGENAFNEPADMTGIVDGWGSGFIDDGLRAGSTDYATWNVYSKDGKKILIAYPYEVAFDDGTKWELGASTISN